MPEKPDSNQSAPASLEWIVFSRESLTATNPVFSFEERRIGQVSTNGASSRHPWPQKAYAASPIGNTCSPDITRPNTSIPQSCL